MTLLSIRNVSLHFGGVQALTGASFDVARGTLTGLIGPNGAGKTTLFNCISGLYRPTGGAIVFDGQPITGLAPDRITARGLIRTFQLARGFARMTVFDHLLLYGQHQPGESLLGALVGDRGAAEREAQLQEKAWAVARRLKLERIVDALPGNISGGQKKLLEIGRALMTDPQMLLLDEPMAGVNPTLVNEIGDHLLALQQEGLTILLIEHDMPLIRRLCDEVIVMADGAFMARGDFDQVAADSRVQEAYLGVVRA
ncbi:ABC transporter ATP-binding protein [Roseateles toxinivorans]|uniref:Amino acid/amide ABC transporter ATP-binding protein 1 (HAAT family) n=1 Tax=Roseateles toxinivorans TaxID=270368 RepID=A0A4R6QH03_9BURK|nr:ABC transporter ATP-binding protein [Roseateles toxinivorans]TDP61263.1 amino acid/amide ABC transporter ATP-binding protein 1 (HAAT family) [Roseateles toxinivorans]